MYARFDHDNIYPRIILAPDGYQPGSGGYVRVLFASVPYISVNAGLSTAMEIAEAEQWSEVLSMALLIAKNEPTPWIPENVMTEWRKAIVAMMESVR